MALLQVQGIRKSFSGLVALKNVNFEVREGEILGLVGPNGAGKSTLINIISGIYRPDSGKVVFRGREITGLPPHRICRLGITRTFQNVETFPELNALENVLVGALFGKRNGDRSEALGRAEEVLRFVDFPQDKLEVKVKNLNVGELKKLQLARALATEPKLLLLDEVTTGLNPKESKDAVKMIRRIRDSGVTILMVEHIMRIIMGVSDRIVVLNYGEKIAEGTPREVANDQRVIESYLGEAYSFEG
jgi:branched-chain amino acid transport system ATP-binding protein